VTIDAVEQPYAPGNVIDHATLAEQLSVPLSLDEGVRSPRDLEQIVRYSAAKIVCLKPPRVGGLANTRTMAQRAAALGLEPYVAGSLNPRSRAESIGCSPITAFPSRAT